MDIKEIKELLRFVSKLGIKEFEFEDGDIRIFLSKSNVKGNVKGKSETEDTVVGAPLVVLNKSKTGETEETDRDMMEGVEITAPIVGTFYEAAAPGAEPFVKEGDMVKRKQPLCIIEAMKIMNEIEAEFDCKILKRATTNGKPVEYGETIFVVEPI